MSEKRHLLMIPAWYPNRDDPDAGVFNANLARALSARDRVSVAYIHLDGDPAAPGAIERAREGDLLTLIDYRPRKVRSGLALPWLYARRFMELLRRASDEFGAPDLIYARNLLPCGFGALAARRRMGIPYVTRESYSGFADQMRSGAKRWFARRILRAARANSAVSRYQRDVMARIFPGVDLEVVPNVIEPGAHVTPAPGTIREKARMIFIGSMRPVKGWDLLLEGLELYVKAGGGPLELTMIGAGEEAELKAKIEALGLSGRVRCLGRRDNTEARAEIARHHFLVLPSRIDTCPNVVLEAMAAGRPVLATRSGGAQDLLDESSGALVERGSAGALAEGFASMIERYDAFDAAAIRGRCEREFGIDRLQAFLDRNLD